MGFFPCSRFGPPSQLSPWPCLEIDLTAESDLPQLFGLHPILLADAELDCFERLCQDVKGAQQTVANDEVCGCQVHELPVVACPAAAVEPLATAGSLAPSWREKPALELEGGKEKKEKKRSWTNLNLRNAGEAQEVAPQAPRAIGSADLRQGSGAPAASPGAARAAKLGRAQFLYKVSTGTYAHRMDAEVEWQHS